MPSSGAAVPAAAKPRRVRNHISFAHLSLVVLANELDCSRMRGWVRNVCSAVVLPRPMLVRQARFRLASQASRNARRRVRDRACGHGLG